MTVVAAVDLDEGSARQLREALDDHGAFSSLAVDLNERSFGTWQIAIYFSGHPDGPTLAALGDLARSALSRPITFNLNELPATDWVAKSLEGLTPVRVGRFVVHGSHDRDSVTPNEIGVEIEAGQAFGTGHHGTTAACLVAIDRLARSRPIRNALDLGTGSGVLAIALAKAAKTQVVASDIDPLAARIARENARLNGVGNRVATVVAAGNEISAIRRSGPFDLIVANILAGPLVKLAPAIRRALAPGGSLILSGLLPEQRRRISAAYRGKCLRLIRAIVRDSWLTIVFERPFRTERRIGRRVRALRG